MQQERDNYIQSPDFDGHRNQCGDPVCQQSRVEGVECTRIHCEVLVEGREMKGIQIQLLELSSGSSPANLSLRAPGDDAHFALFYSLKAQLVVSSQMGELG